MAVGEWTSVQSQAQLVQAEIAKERAEIARSPRAEEAELAAMFRHRGLSRELAARVARELSEDPDEAWRIHVREELGVDPDEQPSPYVAGFSSFVTFAVGAFVPIAAVPARRADAALVAAARCRACCSRWARRWRGSPVDHCGSAERGTWRSAAIAVAVVFGVGSAIGAGVSR